MPGVPGFAVGIGDARHQRVVRRLRQARRNQRARFNLKVVAVPQLFLFRRQGLIEPRADNILHPHQPRVFGIAVVNYRLHHVVVQHRHVVVRFHLAILIAVIKVKAVKIGINRLDGRTRLQQVRACGERFHFCRGGRAGRGDLRRRIIRAAAAEQQGNGGTEPEFLHNYFLLREKTSAWLRNADTQARRQRGNLRLV